jgi:Bacterial extracellular solute-binding proteins, family 3
MAIWHCRFDAQSGWPQADMKCGVLSVGMEMGLGLHRWRLRLLTLVMACIGLMSMALAQTTTTAAPTELRIITRVVQPFVMKDGGIYKGFSVELWQAIAKEMNVTFRWVEVPTVKDILAAMQEGNGDAAIAAVSITSHHNASRNLIFRNRCLIPACKSWCVMTTKVALALCSFGPC